jgi:hypothetical protein
MRARLVPALAALAVLAAGCSGGEDPDVSPTLPPITEAPSGSPSAEVVPSEATAATPEGAAAFVRFFVGEVQAGYEALDPERVRRVSTPECETCKRYIETIETVRDQGARIGDAYTVEVIDAVAPLEEPGASSTSVTLIVRIGEFVVTGADGTELLREPPIDQVVQSVTLNRVRNSWLVNEVVID